jgi:type IV secretory pathway TraG/TraD family ATPase VirD4
VLLFDPTNAASAAYNPLLEVRRGEWEVRDVQNIADILVDPEGALEKRNHWEKTSTRCWSAPSCMSSMPRGQDAGRRRRLPVRSEAPDRATLRR